jgi:hypothetical protein
MQFCVEDHDPTVLLIKKIFVKPKTAFYPSSFPTSFLLVQGEDPDSRSQCCRSGIRCLFDPQDPGSGMGKKPKSGPKINIPYHISESLETIFGLKNLNSLMRIRIRDLFDPGFGIRDARSL